MSRALSLVAVLAAARAASFEVPMRDGVTLHTDYDEPPFASKKLAAVLERSPYGEDAEELIALVFAELLGYVGVRQDMRGTKQSGGKFGIWHDSAPDAFDTIDWITNQTWSNGDVFTTGASADGIDELMQIAAPHPALRAQFVIFATTQAYETFFVGGAYREALIDGWLKGTVPGQYAELDALVRSQETPGGPWWAAVNGTLFYPNVNWPTVMWGGWYDIFQQGNLAAFTAFQARAAPGERGQAKLVIDPCGHCQGAADLFPYDVAFGRVLLPLLLALDLFSNDAPANRTWPAPSEGVKDLTFYVMGADASGASGNYWTTMDVPPTPAYTDYFFVPGPGGAVGAGVLSPSPPPASAGAGVGPFVYDPAKPVPTVGGNNLEIPCGPLDQTPLEQAGRGDLLLFTSAPLAAPLALTGALEATVYISTNVTDTDVTVKLVDVYPADAPTNAGKALIVADGIVRMKWRDAPAGTWDPQPLSGSPADVYAARVTLWNTSYVFAPGHSIRVHVSSSNYPRFLPNLNTGCPLSAPCGNATAATTLHTDAAAGRASKITLPVVTLDQLPPFDVAAAEGALLERHAPRWQAAAPGRKGGAQGLREWLAPRLERVGAAIARRAGGGARRR